MNRGLSRCLVFSFTLVMGSAKSISTHLSTEEFEGWLAFLPVNRSKLQDRLEDINANSGDDDVKYYIPRSLSSGMDFGLKNQHTVMIILDTVSATSVDIGYRGECEVNTRYYGLSFVVPFLSSEPDQPTGKLSLFLSRYSLTEGAVVDPNVAISKLIHAGWNEHLQNSTYTFVNFRHGDFELRIEGHMTGDCKEPTDYVLGAAEDYTGELGISQTPPDFSICDTVDGITVDFCDVWDRYREDITEAGSNVCQYWSHAKDVINCEASFKITEISEKLKEYLTLGDDHVTEVVGEKQRGSFGIGLKFPCVVQSEC